MRNFFVINHTTNQVHMNSGFKSIFQRIPLKFSGTIRNKCYVLYFKALICDYFVQKQNDQESKLIFLWAQTSDVNVL